MTETSYHTVVSCNRSILRYLDSFRKVLIKATKLFYLRVIVDLFSTGLYQFALVYLFF